MCRNISKCIVSGVESARELRSKISVLLAVLVWLIDVWEMIARRLCIGGVEFCEMT